MTIVAKGKQIEAPPEDLLKDPLIWFFAEHHRHRQVCRKLTELAKMNVLDVELTQEILHFLKIELPQHMRDEEEGLFPILRRRCKPEDRLERTLGQLSPQSGADTDITMELVLVLENTLKTKQGLGASETAKYIVQRFCQLHQNHIALENAVVLPIARSRLTKADKKTLTRLLAQGRNLSDPFRNVDH